MQFVLVKLNCLPMEECLWLKNENPYLLLPIIFSADLVLLETGHFNTWEQL